MLTTCWGHAWAGLDAHDHHVLPHRRPTDAQHVSDISLRLPISVPPLDFCTTVHDQVSRRSAQLSSPTPTSVAVDRALVHSHARCDLAVTHVATLEQNLDGGLALGHRGRRRLPVDQPVNYYFVDHWLSPNWVEGKTGWLVAP